MGLQSEAFAQLHQETMSALRIEHPDWSEEVFDGYGAKFAELLRQLGGRARQRLPRFATRLG